MYMSTRTHAERADNPRRLAAEAAVAAATAANWRGPNAREAQDVGDAAVLCAVKAALVVKVEWRRAIAPRLCAARAFEAAASAPALMARCRAIGRDAEDAERAAREEAA